MNPFLDLMVAVDRLWTPDVEIRIRLHLLGSAALFLQTSYLRGTKDGDILETAAIDDSVRSRLFALAGRGSPLHRQHGLYLDVVAASVPLLPTEPLWNSLPIELRHFEIDVLDPHDVVVSKLKRWNAGDRDDTRAMVEGGYVDRDRLVARFEEVVRRYTFDARADLLPDMASRLNGVERDWFTLDPTPFEFPEELFR